MFWIFKLLWRIFDLHVLVHSTVLDKVFVQEADWPLIIADFLAGEDNVWIEEISEDCNDRVQVMKHYHESLAHLKYGSIIDLITRRFWWPDMKKDLKDYISRCPECQLNRSASRTHAPFQLDLFLLSHFPLNAGESTSMDQWWKLRVALEEMTEAAVATFLYDLMMTYGAPFEIISDRGKSFLAEGISEFERENSIRHLATTPLPSPD
ncbi:hypothetical protein BASA83_009478 [Batrachochytrium salamandrivorans]|nr:hypothetical protein BASA83_009478 [Batrachochytrium salamandrivorans]